MGEASPKFMTNWINVMTHCNFRTGVAITINKLVVHLEDELVPVKRLRAVRVQTEMGQSLVSKKARFTLELSQPGESKRPIEFSKQKEKACVGRVSPLRRIGNKAVVARKLVICLVKCRDRLGPGQIVDLPCAGEKQNVRIRVKRGAIDRQRHDQRELLPGIVVREI